MGDKITILHFTDIYNLPSSRWREPVGGAARLQTLIQSFAHADPLVLFSGDALSPSMESQATKGSHMVDALNKLEVNAAVPGNHEFDFGLDNFEEQVGRSSFPWLLSNLVQQKTSLPPSGVLPHLVVERHGHRIGLIGLVGDWSWEQVATRGETFVHTDPVEAARQAVGHLREKEKCEAVVALTHMDKREDERLAREVAGLDLVLAGHNHGYSADRIDGKGIWVVKSGTEFRHLSVIKLTFKEEEDVKVEVEKKDVTSSVACTPGWEGGIPCGQKIKLLPKYAGWAILYHGYKRLARIKRIC